MDLIEDVPRPRTSIFLDFLQVANRASREATEGQRQQIRRLSGQQPSTAQYVTQIEEIMGWR